MKTLRVFCTDPDVTDSSSDEEDENFPETPTKSKRFLREITIAADDLPPEKPTSPPLETPEKVVEKYPGVRKRISGKYTAEIRDPFKKVKIWLGSFNTAKDAYDVYCKKKLEFEALKSEKNGGVEVPEGVKKVNSGKYGVLIDDPKSNTKVWLGSYDSVDEAVRVYREKECEFEEGGVVRKERLLSDLYDGKIDNVVGSCVECSDGKWEGRVWDPVVKSLVSVGVFDTRTQAQFVVRNKEGLFRRRFEVERDECGGGGMADGGSMNGFGYESSDVIIALGAPKLSKEEIAELRKNRGLKLGKVRDGELSRDSRVPGCEFGNVRRETVSGRESGRLCGKVETAKEKTRNFNFVERNTRDKFGPELPPGVRVTKAGRFGAWVTHPISGNDYCLRSYDTIEEALKGIRNKMAQFEKEFSSKKRARPNGDVFGTPKRAVSEAMYGSPTSVLDVRHEEHENSGTNVKIEFEYGPSHNSLDTVFKDKRVINEDVSVYQNNGIDKTSSENQLVFPITFDKLVKSGIINEYGQLLGEYCKCDELMWLSNHNDVN